VRNQAYAPCEYPLSYISESFSQPGGTYKARRIDWTDDELARIRIVLQKLTTLRIINSNDVEDLVQDTLLTMISKCPENNLEKGPLVWSMGILRNKVGNYYKKGRRYTSFNDRQRKAQKPTRHRQSASSPEAKILQNELQSIVNRILLEFPPLQRQAMELLIAGFNAGEIAGQLHPERYQTIINQLYRGRKKLAKELAKHGYGPNLKAG
jgi:RNA polymerase sigma factor (sigma-70 family)